MFLFNRRWFRVEVQDRAKYERDKREGRLYGVTSGAALGLTIAFTGNIPLGIAAGIAGMGAVKFYLMRKAKNENN